jgi:hypothetical protein
MAFLMIEITCGCEEWIVRVSFEALFERSSLAGGDHAGEARAPPENRIGVRERDAELPTRRMHCSWSEW